MALKVKKLSPEAKIPTRAHNDDAGLDLYSVEEHLLQSGERYAVKTGIAVAIPSGYAGLIWDKSGLAIQAGLKTLGGVIDASYRGEIMVIAVNLSAMPYKIEKGAKIAQLLIQRVELLEVKEVVELDDTTRGENGFGSSGL